MLLSTNIHICNISDHLLLAKWPEYIYYNLLNMSQERRDARSLEGPKESKTQLFPCWI